MTFVSPTETLNPNVLLQGPEELLGPLPLWVLEASGGGSIRKSRDLRHQAKSNQWVMESV